MQSIFLSTKKERKKERKSKVEKKIAIIAAVNNSFEMAKRYLWSRRERFLRANFFESSILSLERERESLEHGGDTTFLRRNFDFYDRAPASWLASGTS